MTNVALFRGIVAFFLLVLIIASATPWSEFRALDFTQPFHACSSNRMRIREAIDAYNRDNPPGLNRLGPTELSLLMSKGYLKSPCACPGDTAPRFANEFIQRRAESLEINLGIPLNTKVLVPGGEYSGTNLDTTGRIVCSLHKGFP